MFTAPHQQLLPGIKHVRAKLQNINCLLESSNPARQNSSVAAVMLPYINYLLRNGCKKQDCSMPVRQNSHVASLTCRKRSKNYSHLKRGPVDLIRKCYPQCIPPHTRGVVTSISEAGVDENVAVLKDANKHTITADKIDEEEAEGSDLKKRGKQIYHIPVMVTEVLEALQPENGQVIVDMTFGAGGHAKEILKAAPDVHYIASDRDPFANSIALKIAAEERSQGKITPVLSRFSEVPVHLHEHGIQPGTVDAFFFDLGVSSMQFDRPERGFSLSQDGPLDMRMDGARFPDSPTAADVVNTLSPRDLAHILKKYGEEKKAQQIANIIVEARYTFGTFSRTKQLADIILGAFNSGVFTQDKLSHHAHVATKSFQALRIFVNNELNEINNGLEVARHYLKPQGRCVVISFHSLEDRIVKRHFLDIDINADPSMSIHDHFRNANVSFDVKTIQEDFMTKLWQPLSRKVKEPSPDECWRNPRSRSAKLRAALKV